MTKQRMANYKKDIIRMATQGVIPTTPGLHILHIYHDDTCSIWKVGGVCDCHPDYIQETPSKDTLVEKFQRLMVDNSKIGKE